MCGICGKTNDPHGASVASMNRAMEHRGPDDEGVYTDPAVGLSLGARRLSVIDVAKGSQPLSNEDGTIWAALNGEIYNHPRLRKMLSELGHGFATRTDTEVLVHLYEEYGEEMVYALDGMFAFAIWDSRRRMLLVARDRFGEKPLFYAERNGHLAFASELTALAPEVPLSGDLDPTAVDEYFVFGYVPGRRSILAGVQQLPPGHLMMWRAGAATHSRSYWRPPAAVATASEPLDDMVAELRRLLEASVRSRLIADVPLGVFLSGGLDSTLIAALAAREAAEPIKTFTVGYDVGQVSETDNARATAGEIGSEHHELILSTDEVARRVPETLGSLDQPLADQALPAFHAVAEFARQDVTVAVGGEGADELFGGYPRYRWLARGSSLAGRLPTPLSRRIARALGREWTPGRVRRLSHVLSPDSEMHRQLDWVGGDRAALRGAVYGPRMTEVRSVNDLAETLEELSQGAQPGAGRLMLLDQRHWLPGDVLPKADRASMLVSLEVRTPFLHHELAEFAATVGPRVHTGGGGKRLLRMLLSELMPDTSLRRPKTAFRVPVAEWLRGPLAATLRDQVESGCLVGEGWVDQDVATRLVEEHVVGGRDRSDALWPLIALGLWLDRFRGRDGTP